MTSTPIFVGIDIAKADFVVACRPAGTSWTARNAAAGIAATVDRLRALAPSLIVLEATGGYETALVVALAAAALPVVVANPGVVARIVTGPHDANRQDPHRPMRYDTGRPRAVIRFRISQPRTASLPCQLDSGREGHRR